MSSNSLNIRYVQAGEITDLKAVDNVVIEMFRSNKYSGPRDDLEGFMPGRVLKDGKEVWSFQAAGITKPKFGELVRYGDNDEYIIVIRDKYSVASIVRVNDFAHSAVAMLRGKQVTVGGSSVEALLDIKMAVAHELEIDYWKTPEESAILEVRHAAERLALKELVQKQQAQKEAARAAREEARRLIMHRTKVEAWSLTGQHFFGIPVTGDEWKSLPKGTYCIMMQADVPTEAFIVVKEHSDVKKGRETEVTGTKPVAKQVAYADASPEALDQVQVTIRGETRQVLVFEHVNDLKTLQKSGLNSGTWVGVTPIGKQPMTVYAITKDNITTVGQVAKQQSAAH